MLIIRLRFRQSSRKKKGSRKKQDMMKHRHCTMQDVKQAVKRNLKLHGSLLSVTGQLVKLQKIQD